MTKKIVIFCLAFMFICVFNFSVTFAKYTVSKNVSTIQLTINSQTQDYDVPTNVDNSKVYVRKTFTSGEVLEMENTKTSNNLGEDFKITEDGLYINDTGSSGYWVYIQYIAEDGFSTSLITDHVYYARCEAKIIWIEEGSYFAFGWYDERHDNGSFGVAVNNQNLRSITNGEYKLMSVYGKPRLRGDFVHSNGTVFKGDYPDTLQFGSAAACSQEVYVKNVMMLDLTQIFGAGNEPPQSWCDKNINVDTAQLEWIVPL